MPGVKHGQTRHGSKLSANTVQSRSLLANTGHYWPLTVNNGLSRVCLPVFKTGCDAVLPKSEEKCRKAGTWPTHRLVGQIGSLAHVRMCRFIHLVGSESSVLTYVYVTKSAEFSKFLKINEKCRNVIEKCWNVTEKCREVSKSVQFWRIWLF